MEQVGRSIEDIKIFSSRNISIDDFEIFFSCVKQVGWSIDANLANWPNLAQTGFSNITLSRNIRIDEKEDLQISSKYIFDISCRWWGLDSVTCVLLNISPSHDLLIDLLPDTESVLQTNKIWYINDLLIDLLFDPLFDTSLIFCLIQTSDILYQPPIAFACLIHQGERVILKVIQDIWRLPQYINDISPDIHRWPSADINLEMMMIVYLWSSVLRSKVKENVAEL